MYFLYHYYRTNGKEVIGLDSQNIHPPDGVKHYIKTHFSLPLRLLYMNYEAFFEFINAIKIPALFNTNQSRTLFFNYIRYILFLVRVEQNLKKEYSLC